MRWRALLGRLALVPAALLALCGTTPAAEERGVDALGREYWLYTPEKVEPGRRYTLVVGVHAYGGSGRYAGGLAGWVGERDDVIVAGPSFPNDGYQVLERESGEQLVQLFAALRKRFQLHPKLFIAGFSGGAQFAHRFAIRHPELIAGCAAHSGGSWAVGGRAKLFGREVELMEPTAAAAGVPFVLAKAKQYVLVAEQWPGVGHFLSPGARRLTAECFLLAVGARAAAAERIARAEARLAAAIGKRFAQHLAVQLAARIQAIVQEGLDAVAHAKTAAALHALGERYAGVTKVGAAVRAALAALEK
ncbi:MAG: alpha/beta hydrolase family protein [Planctomycetota bacterium]|jgi:pimeloyl-ACP methyl ester carboxylesterase